MIFHVCPSNVPTNFIYSFFFGLLSGNSNIVKVPSKNFSEKDIIHKYITKLNFQKKETFNFKNDGAFLKKKKNKEIVVTNDTILESVDFFKSDDEKVVTTVCKPKL